MLPPKLNCNIVDIVYSGIEKEKNTKHWSKTLDAIHNFHDITVEREDIQGIQTCSALQPPRWGDSTASTQIRRTGWRTQITGVEDGVGPAART